MRPQNFKDTLPALSLVAAAAFAPGHARADGMTDLDFRLALRGQFAFVEDASWQAIGDDRMMGGGEVGLDVGFGERLFAGASYAGRALNGQTYTTFDTTLGGQAVRGSVGWRWHPDRTVQLYGRAGVGAWWWDLELDSNDGTASVTEEAFRPGFFAGVGLDVWFVGPASEAPKDRAERFALGANVELTYDRFLPLDLRHDGRSLGTIDPSGPGFLAGFVLQF